MIAYLDMPSGISGDIFLGCLLDAGWPVEKLRELVTALNLPAQEWSIGSYEVMKGAIRATFADIHAKEGHVHRHLSDIKTIINAANIADSIKKRSIAVFTRLAQAEARIHGTTLDAVHFHEVGAVDAIIDIVGVVAGLHDLGVTELYASALPMGSGWTKSAHGQIPLPAPATLEILAGAQAPVVPAPGPGEWVTPTGAALVAELAIFKQPAMRVSKIATGAGRRDCAWPNVARLWLGESNSHSELVILETNIDDMNPQLYAPIMEKLFSAGAKDVWMTPIQMKKNRPAVMLSVLAPAMIQMALSELILRDTSTLGVRVVPISHRYEAQREFHKVATPYGEINAKLKRVDGAPIGITPEYDDCIALAASSKQSVHQVYDAALQASLNLLERLQQNTDQHPQKKSSDRPLIFINTQSKITDK